MPLFEGTLSTRGIELCHDKLVLGAAHSEDLVILSCVILTQYRSVMDGQTDRQMDAHLDDG